MRWCLGNYRSEICEMRNGRRGGGETVTNELRENREICGSDYRAGFLAASGFLGPQVMKVRANAVDDGWRRRLGRGGLEVRRLCCAWWSRGGGGRRCSL